MRLRRLGLWFFALILISGLGLWAARDLPQRIVAAVLSDRLSAQVQVEELEVLGSDRLRLVSVSITDFRDYPFIERLRLEEIQVESRFRDLLKSRYERLVLHGLEARLVPAGPVTPPDRPLPVIAELILEPAILRIASGPGQNDLQLELDATLHNIGSEDSPQVQGLGPRANGELSLNSDSVQLQPFFALVGTAPPPVEAQIDALESTLTFDPSGTELVARTSSARLEGVGDESPSPASLQLSRPHLTIEQLGQQIELGLTADDATATTASGQMTTEEPSASATLIQSDGVWNVELEPRIQGLDQGRLVGAWNPTLERLLHLDVKLHGLDLEQLLPDSGVQATADLKTHIDGDAVEVQLDVQPRQLVLAADRHLSDLNDAKIQVRGQLPLDLAQLRIPAWGGPLTVEVDLPKARGRWGSLRLPSQTLPLTASFIGSWQGLESPRFVGESRLESPAGRLSADGEIKLPASLLSGEGGKPQADMNWVWQDIDLESLIRWLQATGLAVPDLEVQGTGKARGSLRGSGIAGKLELQRLGYARETSAGVFGLSDGEARLDGNWSGGQTPVQLSKARISGMVSIPGIEPLAIDLDASGRLAPSLKSGRVDAKIQEATSADSQAPELGVATLAAKWQAPTEISGRLNLEGLDLDRWQHLVTTLAEAESLSDFTLRGQLDADLEIALAGESWRLDGPVHLDSAGFTSLDGSRVTEGLASHWQLAARGGLSTPIKVEGEGQLGGFLLLWNTYFGDFSEIEASLTARAELGLAENGSRPWRLELESSLEEGPIAAATLETGEGDALRYTLTFDDTDLAATHRRYLKPLLEAQLGGLELDGKLAGRVRGHVQPGNPVVWDLIGGVEIQNLDLASGGGQATVTGLSLDLPLHLQRRPTADVDYTGPRLGGQLAFEHLAVRGLELPPTESDLSVEADSIGLEKPVILSVLGGAVSLERLTLRELLRPSRHLESSIDLSDISLERISEELELLPMEGALNGRLAGVRLSPSILTVDGGGELEVFGGTVKVRDISGEDVLSRFPKLELSADFRDIDLGALTRRIDFGEMTGILEGNIEDLELFRGVPVRFSARFGTTHRKGVPRTVDVKAVNNITILGTGQRAGVLDRGIQKFFDRYTYERLGVDMRLDRDVLLLRGLELRGDKELFLRGRLPFRIDVVNAQPGKTVSFQAMVARLKSLDFARATTER